MCRSALVMCYNFLFLHSRLSKEPVGSPLDLRVTTSTKSIIKCEWNEVYHHCQNGQITGYRLHVLLFNRSVRKVNLRGARSTSYTIDKTLHIPCNHMYTLAIAAVNAAGVGPFRVIPRLGNISEGMEGNR